MGFYFLMGGIGKELRNLWFRSTWSNPYNPRIILTTSSLKIMRYKLTYAHKYQILSTCLRCLFIVMKSPRLISHYVAVFVLRLKF